MGQATRVYTKHGIRAHYQVPMAAFTGHPFTYCGKRAVTLESRSRFFRRRLAQASVCGRCEKAEELLG